MDMFVSRLQGVSIPLARIDRLEWSVTAVGKISVTSEENTDAVSEFWLEQHTMVTFFRKLYRIGEKDAIIVESATVPYSLEKEKLLSSDMFNQLSEKASERLQEVLHDISKYTGRVKKNEHNLAEIRKLISEEDGDSNDQVKFLKKQVRICNKKLTSALEKLAEFEEKKSAVIVEGELTCEDLSIFQARQTKFWTENDVEDFYNKIMDEELRESSPSIFNTLEMQDDLESDDDVNSPNNSEFSDFDVEEFHGPEAVHEYEKDKATMMHQLNIAQNETDTPNL